MAVSIPTPQTPTRAITTPARRYPPVLERGGERLGCGILVLLCLLGHARFLWGCLGMEDLDATGRDGESRDMEGPILGHFSRGTNIHC